MNRTKGGALWIIEKNRENANEQAEALIKEMLGMSDEGFARNKCFNPIFAKGCEVISRLFLNQKDEVELSPLDEEKLYNLCNPVNKSFK